MMMREQLLHLFSRFSFLTSLPEVKQRIADAVRDKQEAVAVTRDTGGYPSRDGDRFGIGCLGKVNVVYESDMDLMIMMIKFYQFVAKEEIAIDEPREFAEKIHARQKLQEQQLKMLAQMRKYTPESQSVIHETVRSIHPLSLSSLTETHA